MKKILLLLVLLSTVGCDTRFTKDPEKIGRLVSSLATLIELTFDGETHEYVFYEKGYEGSLSHWEGCKYCKQQNNK